MSNLYHTQAATVTKEVVLEESNANITVDIAALEFTGVIQQNGRGAFDLMMKDLAKSSTVNHNYQVYSPARGAKMLFSGRSDCLIPGSLYPPYYKNMAVIHSESFTKVRYIAFTLPKEKAIISKAELSGKVIGILRDEDTWNYEQRFQIKNAKYVKVSTLESLVEMLYHQRIDVAIHDQSDFITMAKHLKKAVPNYDITKPMAIDKIVISCHDNAKNRAYLQAISPFLQDMNKNKSIRKYFQQSSIK